MKKVRMLVEVITDAETGMTVLSLLTGEVEAKVVKVEDVQEGEGPVLPNPLTSRGKERKRRRAHPYRPAKGEKQLIEVIMDILQGHPNGASVAQIKAEVRRLKTFKPSSVSTALSVLARTSRVSRSDGMYALQQS